MANKVKYGLKNIHVFPITEDTSEKITYDKAIPIQGAVSLSMKASGDSNEFYADDVVYWGEYSNNGYDGDLEIAKIPEEFETAILGFIKDKNGAIVESTEVKSKNFAIAFEIDGDVNQVRHILYKCSVSRPDVEGETKKEKIEPKTDKLSLKAMATLKDGLIKAKLEKGKTGYDTFMTAPYMPTPVAGV
ncbi:MAG: phage tail protein [Peptostreptococcaceae bacterium]|nr:phage tail protein [Peptostreptococcaceae bacterium]